MCTELSTPALEQQLRQLSDAELASLVIEFVGVEGAGLPIGEEIYRRLQYTARLGVIAGLRPKVRPIVPTETLVLAA